MGGQELQELRAFRRPRRRRLRLPPRGNPWWDHLSNDPSSHALHELELPAIGKGGWWRNVEILGLRFGLGLPEPCPTYFAAWQDVDCAECFVEVLGCHI